MDIVEERGRSYGDPGVNLGRIAGMWGAYLGCEVTAHDVAWMMALLKASRSKADPQNVDNYVDGRGYVDIAERVR